MKFQCDSCGAKYKIADEKVVGRSNVRFTCRRCSHKILLSDPSASRSAGATSAATHGITAVQPATSDDFMTAKRHGVQSSGKPTPNADEAIWHVSINDVPIGPIKREELAHKIDSGAVSEYSLVWNASFDEWRPLATVPELMSLIHNRRGSQPPMTSRFSSAPPEGRTRVAQVSEALRASSLPQRTMAAAPGASDPFGQAYPQEAPAKRQAQAELLEDPFASTSISTTMGDAFDQPTVSSMLDEQPTVNSMLDERLAQPTVSSMLDEQPTVNSMLDDQPTTNSLLDDIELTTSLVDDPLAPAVGASRPDNPPPPGIPVPRHDGSGSFSTVLTASSFSPEAMESPGAAPSTLPVGSRKSTPAQERRSVGAAHPLGQYPRASSLPVRAEEPYPSVPAAPQPVGDTQPGMSPWAWAMVASCAVFAAVLAVLVFNKLVSEGELDPFSLLGLGTAGEEAAEEMPAESITEMELTEAETIDPALEPELGPEDSQGLFDSSAEMSGLAPNSVQLSAEGTDMEFGLDDSETDEAAEAESAPEASKAKPKAQPRRKSTSTTSSATSKTSGIRRLEPEPNEQGAKLLAQFADSGTQGPAKIDVAESPSSQAQRKPLDERDLATVVNRNKPRLQRCYERAVRGQQAPPSVRLDVSVKVAASGRVTSATASGRGPGGLTECVESLVRRWRFPVSSESVETRFPVVFSAG